MCLSGIASQKMCFFFKEFRYFARRWLERPPREREVMGSIPGRDRPESLKLAVVAFLLGAQDYGNNTTTGVRIIDWSSTG